ncbi:MAG: rod-determining factor RdfA [Halosimplex sp.]
MTSDDPAGTNSKVARLVSAYGLAEFADELVERWTAEAGERTSLRDLADEFNRRLLRARMRETGRSPMERTVRRTYEALTADDVSEGRRAEVRNELERDGVDVDALLADFVSHQSVHTYLTTVRGASPPSADVDPVDSDVETIRRLIGRTTSVAGGTLERHRDAERLVLGDFDVFLDLRVLCHECGADRDVVELLEAGGCACGDPARSIDT